MRERRIDQGVVGEGGFGLPVDHQPAGESVPLLLDRRQRGITAADASAARCAAGVTEILGPEQQLARNRCRGLFVVRIARAGGDLPIVRYVPIRLGSEEGRVGNEWVHTL